METRIADSVPVVNNSKKFVFKKIILWVLGGIVLVGLLTTSLFSFRSINSLSKKVVSLQKKVTDLEFKYMMMEIKEYRKGQGNVDLTIPNIQDIDNVFKVAKLSVEPQLTGVNVSGLMINSSSLIYENIKFAIIVNGNRREFTVSKISPGNSTRFEVYIPNTPVNKSESGKIEFIESVVRYYNQ